MKNEKNKDKEPNRYLSSDETQPIEGNPNETRPETRQPSENEFGVDNESTATRINDGMSAQHSHFDDSVHLPSMFASGLAPETKENLERVLTRGREILNDTRSYVKENPAEAAGLLACSGAILWALFGTKPGRRIVELGTPLLSTYVASNFNSTFGLQGRQLQ